MAGRAGRDYPILSYIPLTSFGCDLVADYPGYYADMEAGCQVRARAVKVGEGWQVKSG